MDLIVLVPTFFYLLNIFLYQFVDGRNFLDLWFAFLHTHLFKKQKGYTERKVPIRVD